MWIWANEAIVLLIFQILRHDDIIFSNDAIVTWKVRFPNIFLCIVLGLKSKYNCEKSH